MITLKRFTFNPFQLNSYVLYDETKECVIIDPGCQTPEEQQTLSNFITTNNLKPVKLLNTHCHLDHIMGNSYVKNTYNLALEAHTEDSFLIDFQMEHCNKYGLTCEQSPQIDVELDNVPTVTFGNSELNLIHVPGHSPGSIVFHSTKDALMVVGDVIFQGSVGRGDLPRGNFDQLIEGIKTKLLVLPPETEIHSGHGNVTTIGQEIKTNQFLQ